MIAVERADFVSVPVQDMERAKRFYSETLGIHSPNLDAGWPEFETGSVSLYLVDPTQIGAEFKPHGSHIALRVPDVAEAKAKLEAAGVEVNEMWDSGVCRGAGLRDPSGNPILLHRRYKPYEQG